MSSDAVIEVAPGDERINEYRGPYHWYLPAFFDYLHRAQLGPVFQRLPRTARVLDLGCGDGRLTHFLAQRYAFVVGLDPQHVALELARMMTKLHGTRPKFVEADAACLPFAPQTFDCVAAFDVIEHLPLRAARALLLEARRLLGPTGVLVLTTPNRLSLKNRVLGHRLDPKHYFEFSASELAAELCTARFELKALEGLYLPPPVPRIEHFASVAPFRTVFRFLAKAGRPWPSLSEKLVAVASPL